MSSLPVELYRAEQVRELDRIAIEQRNIAGYELMNRAGAAVFAYVTEKYPHANAITVFCGAGNNAGDGYVVARLALLAGLAVRVYALSAAEKLRGDALTAFRQYQKNNGTTLAYQAGFDDDAEIIIDGLLGTGLDRQVTGLYADAIETINRSAKPVIALDIPSGLNADTGKVMGCAVKAEATVTFIGLKQGLFTGDAAEHCGEIVFSSLAAPEDIYRLVNPASLRIERPLMPRRNHCAHKGDNGHVLVVGGDRGFSGAARMAAEAAARAGAGLVSVATRTEHAALLNIGRPELMCHGVETPDQLRVLMEKATVIVIGPGLGQSSWASALFNAVLQCRKPLIIDADGLNLLADNPQTNNNWILTPHPGEAARLLQWTNQDIQKDRFVSVSALQKKYHGIVLLKGAGSLLDDGNNIYLATTGNPGMASGGFGDVLCGVIGALIAQGINNAEAVRMAVYWHGEAADIAAAEGQRGLLASDLMPYLRKLVNGL